MATREELDTLMHDARLSADARVVGYVIGAKNSREPVEIEADELDDALGADPNPKRRRRALRQLERRGYVVQTAGGRGHPDRFLFRVPDPATLKPDRVPTRATLKAEAVEPEEVYPSPKRNPKTDRVAATATLNAASRAGSTNAVDAGDGDDGIEGRAAEAIEQHADLLSGCTGALRDYLVAHVQPKKQAGYVQMLATWLNGFGFVWKDASGGTIAAEDRTGLIAAALNELDSQGEDDLKYDEGDPRNLRTKLSILSRPIERPTPAMTSNDEQRHYRGHRDQAAHRPASNGPRSLGSSKAPDPTSGDEAQRWAAEHPDDFERIKDEIAQVEGIDRDDQLERLRLTGLAIQRVRDEQLAESP